MNKIDGGPAFPVPGFPNDESFNGMSLRDYFAAQALAALIGHERKEDINRGKSAVPKLCKWAYEYADAMILERGKW